MKTVLFIDREEGELWDSFLQHDYLLRDWLWEENIVICPWHRESCTTLGSIPDLADVLEGEQEWVAIIASDLRGAKSSAPGEVDKYINNPFDFPENYTVDSLAGMEESKRPIVRLTQMLGGVPDRVALVSYSSGMRGGFNEHEIMHPRPDGYLSYLDRYTLEVPRPQRIVCVTPRDYSEEVTCELNIQYVPEEDGMASRFWERNGYAPSTRFVAVNFCADTGGEAQGDIFRSYGVLTRKQDRLWLQYWLCVLVISMNEFTNNDLRAYTLYAMSMRLDGSRLQKDAAHRQAIWVAARDLIRMRMQLEESSLKRSERVRTSVPDCEETIPVELEFKNGLQSYVKDSGVGMFRGLPKDDAEVWKSEYGRATDVFREQLWAPRRGVRNATLSFREKGTFAEDELEYCILNQYETERMEDSVRVEEETLARDLVTAPFAYEHYRKSFETCNQDVLNDIDGRSTRGGSLLTIGLCTLAFCFGLFPLVLRGSRDSIALVRAGTIGTLCALLLVVTGIVVLFRQRKRIVRAYAAFNETMLDAQDEMSKNADVMTKRISGYATIRRAWSVLMRQHQASVPTRKMRWLREKEALINERIGDLQVLTGDTSSFDRVAYRSVMARGWEQISLDLDDESFFDLHMLEPTVRSLNESIRSGSSVVVPFAFITSVEVLPEELRGYVLQEETEGGAA